MRYDRKNEEVKRYKATTTTTQKRTLFTDVPAKPKVVHFCVLVSIFNTADASQAGQYIFPSIPTTPPNHLYFRAAHVSYDARATGNSIQTSDLLAQTTAVAVVDDDVIGFVSITNTVSA